MTWKEDKKQRTLHYFKNVYKKKEQLCMACNGSGYYDTNGSPPCEACGGKGKIKALWVKEKNQ